MSQTFYAAYPAGNSGSTNPSVGANGQPIPGDSTFAAGENPSGNLQPLQTDSSGNLLVSLNADPSSPLAVNLTEVGGTAVTLGQKVSASSLPVVIASDDTVAISASSLPLPTGAATSADQTNVQSSPGTSAGTAVTVQGSASGVALPISASTLPLPSNAATATNQTNVQSAPGSSQTTALTVQGNASGIAIPVSASALPLPTGAATSANQTNASQKTQIVDGSGNVIASTSNALNVAQGTAANLNATVVQGTATNLKCTANLNDGSGNSISSTTGYLDVFVENSSIGVNVIGQSTSSTANSSAATTSLSNSLVIKASPGRLYQLTGVNTNTSPQYIQVFNSTTVPADTTVPILLAYVPASTNFSFDFGSIGRYFGTGIVVTNSSTAATKTIGSANCWFNAEYL